MVWYWEDLRAKLLKYSEARNKPDFTPYVDTGDFVLLLKNAEKVAMTGKNLDPKDLKETFRMALEDLRKQKI